MPTTLLLAPLPVFENCKIDISVVVRCSISIYTGDQKKTPQVQKLLYT